MKRTLVAATAAAAVLASAVSAHGSRVAKCSTADLHVWVTHTGAALGTVGGYLAFTNRRARACSLHGWPTLTALRPGATATAVHVRQTMFGPDGVRSIPTVVLRHGQTAVAAFTTSDIGRGPTGACPPSFRELRVTPPGNRWSAVVSAYLAWFGRELPDCTGIFVSTVAPASALPPRG